MRLDLYLKTSRLIKRRAVAKEVADGGNVSVNGRKAKPSTEISVGDQIEMKLGRHIIGIKVLQVCNHVIASQAEEMYEVIYQDSVDDRRS